MPYEIIKKKIKDGNMTLEGLASCMNMSRTTLYRLMKNNFKSGTIEELKALIIALNLTKQEVLDIFFIQEIPQDGN